jgi:hypothetical protein
MKAVPIFAVTSMPQKVPISSAVHCITPPDTDSSSVVLSSRMSSTSLLIFHLLRVLPACVGAMFSIALFDNMSNQPSLPRSKMDKLPGNTRKPSHAGHLLGSL